MPLILFVHLLLGASLLVALGFHRYRAAQVCALLWLGLHASGSHDQRLVMAASSMLPWLLLLSAVVPEARLLSRRHALFVALAGSIWGMAVFAPVSVLERLFELTRLPLPGLPAIAAWGAPGVMAALVCLLRWIRSGHAMEFGLALALALATAGGTLVADLPSWYAAAASSLLLAILWSSYRMAFIDQLTGLPNRRALDETLARLSGSYTLAMVDIDHFKSFNDTYGHDAGDIVLRAVARNLRRNAGGRTFRYGGEEFCVVYGGASSTEVVGYLDHVREQIETDRVAIAAPRKTSRKRAKGTSRRRSGSEAGVSVTISAGCAPRDHRRREPAEVLKSADKALYKAKAQGRNRVVKG